MKLRQAFESIYIPNCNCSARSLARIRHDLNRWERAAPPVRIERISRETICEFRRTSKLSPDTVETTIDTVLAILRMCCAVGVIRSVPHPGRRLKRRQVPKYVPPLEDFSRLYAHADAARWPRGMDRERFWRAVLCVAYWTGLRLTDLFYRLTWDAVTADGIFLCAGKTGKSHSFPMHRIVQRHLDMVRNWSTDRVFAVGRSNKQILRSFHEMSEAAGVKLVTAQTIRRLSATEWQRAKWGAGELVQGSGIRGSARVYIVPHLLQQAAPLVAWPDSMMTPEERDQRQRDETVLLESFRRLDETARAVVLAAAERLAS